jgi:hypothetical protein
MHLFFVPVQPEPTAAMHSTNFYPTCAVRNRRTRAHACEDVYLHTKSTTHRTNLYCTCTVETGERVSCLRGHLDGVTCIAVQPRTEQVFSAGYDCNVLVWAPPQPVVEGLSDGPKGDAEARDNWSDDD